MGPPYSNDVCPICGKNAYQVRVWSHCPMHRAIVCMDHCYNDCPFYDPLVTHCRFRDRGKET